MTTTTQFITPFSCRMSLRTLIQQHHHHHHHHHSEPPHHQHQSSSTPTATNSTTTSPSSEASMTSASVSSSSSSVATFHYDVSIYIHFSSSPFTPFTIVVLSFIRLQMLPKVAIDASHSPVDIFLYLLFHLCFPSLSHFSHLSLYNSIFSAPSCITKM